MRKDICFWCHKWKCHKGHGLEIASYRTRLHFEAVVALREKRLSGSPVDVELEQRVEELMNLRAGDMGIREQRAKAYFREYCKTMGRWEALEKAYKQADKDGKATHPVYPTFTREEWGKIQRYRPKNGSM